MKKTTVLIICLLLPFSAGLARERKDKNAAGDGGNFSWHRSGAQNHSGRISGNDITDNALRFAKNGARANRKNMSADRHTFQKRGGRDNWVWHHPRKDKPARRYYRPSTYCPYSYYYYRPSGGAHIRLSFFPFRNMSVSYGYGYNYDYYRYYPYYAWAAAYNTYNNYSGFGSEKLSADRTFLEKDEQDEQADDDEAFDINRIKIRKTRLITGNGGNSIGFEINNASAYHIAAVTFKITVRAADSAQSRCGIFYKLEKVLRPGQARFYKMPIDELNLSIPETYAVFADLESIISSCGETVSAQED